MEQLMKKSAHTSGGKLFGLHGRRIQVVGHAGAGKTVFSEKLSTILGTTVLHLDPVFWSNDWVSTPVTEAQALVREYIDQPEWVIDGNQWVPLKHITYPAATDILWIDPPFYVWVYRLFSRAIKNVWSGSGTFYKDFMNPKTSIIVLAFQRRSKKSQNWTKMLERDSRWQRIVNTDSFLKSIEEQRRID